MSIQTKNIAFLTGMIVSKVRMSDVNIYPQADFAIESSMQINNSIKVDKHFIRVVGTMADKMKDVEPGRTVALEGTLKYSNGIGYVETTNIDVL